MNLELTIKRKWFDMIADGVKKEEYRRDSRWIMSRLLRLESDGNFHDVHYDAVRFRNGYSKDSPIVMCKYLGWKYGYGNPEWGGERHPGFQLIVIKLGALI